MRRLGLIGGMSWESTALYYRALNEGVRARLGGLHSAELLLHSVDFAGIEALQRTGDWMQAGEVLAEAALGLQRAGAEGLLLCTNTMHKVAPAIEARCTLPLLHIADAAGAAIRAAGLQRVALLGTRFTMREAFYRERLHERFGLVVEVPDEAAQDGIDRVIFDELCLGRIEESSRARYREVCADLLARGCEGVILGCTEIGLLLGPGDVPAPLFDTAALHVEAALDWALA
ncbi:aspartate/glutamate racemase family protein [Aquimonas voraii]|uniref:Aspartate racemase n=1 Tax=Aquimonas voraii TaxID=265719 RepID=A0A1G6Y0R8_9GAMM|nr:amino acid racemase [Aquimonas voraii]SDD84064.1 aspartate racemase [Aquimonas voraii]